MPYTINWEERGVHCEFFGTCTIKDLVAVFTEIGQDRRFPDLRYQIFDYLAVEDHFVTKEQLTELAALSYAHALTNPRAKRVSVSNDARIEQLISYYISVNENPHKQKFCRTLHDARDWISESGNENARL